jgi:hypothetical protein
MTGLLAVLALCAALRDSCLPAGDEPQAGAAPEVRRRAPKTGRVSRR